MPQDMEVGKARADEYGRVFLTDGDGNDVVMFEDPQRAVDAAAALSDAAGLGLTQKASRIAEERALLGSASHHYGRGASSSFAYDRRDAHLIGPPLEEGDLVAPPAAAPAIAPGNSPATGTSEESNRALELLRTGGPAGAGGALAEPPFGADVGLQGGPPGTVSPEPPSKEGSLAEEQGVGNLTQGVEGSTGPGASATEPQTASNQADQADTGSGPYEGRTVSQLQALARQQEVKPASRRKEDIIAALRV